MKPREWSIDYQLEGENCWENIEGPNTEGNVHVIEKSAYDEAIANFKSYVKTSQEEIKELLEERQKLEKERDTFRDDYIERCRLYNELKAVLKSIIEADIDQHGAPWGALEDAKEVLKRHELGSNK